MSCESLLRHTSNTIGPASTFLSCRNDVTSENWRLCWRVHVSFSQVEVKKSQVRVAAGHCPIEPYFKFLSLSKTRKGAESNVGFYLECVWESGRSRRSYWRQQVVEEVVNCIQLAQKVEEMGFSTSKYHHYRDLQWQMLRRMGMLQWAGPTTLKARAEHRHAQCLQCWLCQNMHTTNGNHATCML